MTGVREAATVMLVRDAPDLHVFMLRRNLNSDFVGGAYVFPGGAVDQEDREPRILDRCGALDDATASRRLGIVAGGLGFWVAAARETFEEAGVLLAVRADGSPLASTAGLAADRAALARGDLSFADLLERDDLLVDTASLHVFSHWITPAGMPRRYDTWFFVARAPEGHGYVHDDGETVASTWVRPRDALDRALRQELEIIFPTQKNLEAIARFEHTDALVDAAGSASSVAAVQPRIVVDGDGMRILLPGDAGYDEAGEAPEGSLGPIAVSDLRGQGEGVA